MATTAGNAVVKSYSAFTVNEGLLAKVVEAVKQGERDARRYGQIRSFEIHYTGHRHNLVLGRIMLIPAKIADSIEDFPSALLYGAMINELHGEQVADVYMHKLGESEFDEYNDKDLVAIKERLFKDAEGNFRTLVMFIPTWAAPRDYVTFKFSRDDNHLTMMIRHMIYAVYFDPALSSMFNELSNDLRTDQGDVVDITPKLNFPFLAENLLKQYPQLEPGDKTAATRLPKMVLAKENIDEIKKELLEPGEEAVMNALSEDLKAHVNGEISTSEEVAKEAAWFGNGKAPKEDKGEYPQFYDMGRAAFDKGMLGFPYKDQEFMDAIAGMKNPQRTFQCWQAGWLAGEGADRAAKAAPKAPRAMPGTEPKAASVVPSAAMNAEQSQCDHQWAENFWRNPHDTSITDYFCPNCSAHGQGKVANSTDAAGAETDAPEGEDSAKVATSISQDSNEAHSQTETPAEVSDATALPTLAEVVTEAASVTAAVKNEPIAPAKTREAGQASCTRTWRRELEGHRQERSWQAQGCRRR